MMIVSKSVSGRGRPARRPLPLVMSAVNLSPFLKVSILGAFAWAKPATDGAT